MDKEELEMYVTDTLDFDSIDEAFDDFVYDFTTDELMEYISDKEKERILKTSPSYVKRNDKWYFNGAFQELEQKDINKIIREKERE